MKLLSHSLIGLALCSLLSGLLMTSNAFAETTGSDEEIAPVLETPKAIQNCRTKLQVKGEAHLYDFIGGQKMGHHYSSNNPPLKINRISGDWAEVRWSTASGWVKKSAFDPDQFEALRKECNSPLSSLFERREDRGTGDLGDTVLSEKVQSGDITKEYNELLRFYKNRNRTERYAFINKPILHNGRMFQTYVVDMTTGEVKKTFASLMGYNGIGCGKGQTRPGIFEMHSASGTGASKKDHWGNNWQYQVIQNIGGHGQAYGGKNCGVDMQIVAHSNINMTGVRSNGLRYSAGCFVTSPDIFDSYTSKLAGNALIYNVSEEQMKSN